MSNNSKTVMLHTARLRLDEARRMIRSAGLDPDNADLILSLIDVADLAMVEAREVSAAQAS